jgi:hypothetical protein
LTDIAEVHPGTSAQLQSCTQIVQRETLMKRVLELTGGISMSAQPQWKETDQPGLGVSLGCQHCGCRTAFVERGPAGQPGVPVFRCCQCGRGRDDLKQFAA